MLSQERGEHAGCAGGSSNLVAAAGAIPDHNLHKEKAEISYVSKQAGALDSGGRGSEIQPPEGISLQENYLPCKAAGIALKCFQA